MKKNIKILIIALAASTLLTSCGGMSGKVKQKISEIEVGNTFSVSESFECKEGVSVSLKAGENIDTSSIGTKKATFNISDGNNTEEVEYTFKVVDTVPPEIEATDITVYKGSVFEPEKYALVTDNSGESLTAVVKSNNVDTTQEGNYSVVYEVTDSAGNTTDKEIAVEVLSIETAEDVMDLIDEYLSKNGYSEYKYYKNTYDAVFVDGPEFDRYQVDSNRTLSIYPEIYMLENIFDGRFGVSKIIFRMELRDDGEQSKRYNLVADTMEIKSGSDSIALKFDGIPSVGEFETSHYTSKFFYELDTSEADKFKQMVDEGKISFEMKTQNMETDYSTFPGTTTYTAVPIIYELSSEDISIMKRTIEIYDYLLDVLGEY